MGTAAHFSCQTHASREIAQPVQIINAVEFSVAFFCAGVNLRYLAKLMPFFLGNFLFDIFSVFF